uniref:C1q domain-containing protein n=1 Tax=Mola mola TaxID=94237 RepID=A0A3Q3VS92_MOLML
MFQMCVVSCLLSVVLSQSMYSSAKRGPNITILPSQLVCSLPGPAGPAGNPGAPGSPGAVGPMGSPGKDGPDGKDGEKGQKGDGGDAGRTGNQGKPGIKGREGVIGKAGPWGRKGPRGSPGVAGKQGEKGGTGEVGRQGAPGRCNCGSAARSAFSVAFVCTIPGVYYFSYDITLANKHLAIGLVHNGQYKIKTFDANTGNHDVASGSTVLHLQQSDQVWLQIFYSEQNGLFFDPFWTDSTFTGFLINPDQDFLIESDRKANSQDDS